MDFTVLLQQTINAVSSGAIYALFALGYALVFSILGVLNLAHSAVFAWGAFFGLLALDKLGLPALPALIVAMLGCGVLSVMLEFLAFRPLRRRNATRIAQLISSIGAALLLVNIAQLIYVSLYNTTEAYYPQDIAILPFITNEPIIIGDLRISPIRIVILLLALGIMVLLQYLVTRTRTGQQMRAVAFNQRTASLLGIHVSRIFVITFFLAGAFGGAAGMMYGLAFNRVTPFIGNDVALIGLTAIVLGGMGSIGGAVAGGFIVAILQTASVALGGSSYRDAIVFLLLFGVLLLRPQGLFGQTESTRA